MQITDDRQEETQTFPALTREGRFPSERPIFLILVGLGLAVLYVGWSTFWFMTDDAFIAFPSANSG